MNLTYRGGIIGTGSFLPEQILTNQDLEKIVDTSDEWITTRTGIKERRIADKDTATSDLATKAARNALEKAGMEASEIDLIIVATITPDMNFPSTACIVQSNLKACNAVAFDISAACTGFIYSVVTANQFISTGLYKNVLVIGAETLSKFVDWQDRNTCVLFGDGAGAVVMSRAKEGYGVLAQYLGADGTGGDALAIDAGGSRNPASLETIRRKMHYIRMDGNEVFKFAVRVMASAAEEAARIAGLEKSDVDYLVPHQANIRIIEAARKRIGLPEKRVYVNLSKYGNMSAASIPVALDEAVNSGEIKTGDNVILVGFGAGLTWGSCLVRWDC
jgi:3-oxoacyl-[acyl-carrier-protein] synthase-3